MVLYLQRHAELEVRGQVQVQRARLRGVPCVLEVLRDPLHLVVKLPLLLDLLFMLLLVVRKKRSKNQNARRRKYLPSTERRRTQNITPQANDAL